MQVAVLGPLTPTSEGRAVALGGPKQRAVLALLALDAGRVVPLDRLVHDIWRGEPPAQATLALQAYVSRLRRLLDGVSRPVHPGRSTAECNRRFNSSADLRIRT